MDHRQGNTYGQYGNHRKRYCRIGGKLVCLYSGFLHCGNSASDTVVAKFSPLNSLSAEAIPLICCHISLFFFFLFVCFSKHFVPFFFYFLLFSYVSCCMATFSFWLLFLVGYFTFTFFFFLLLIVLLCYLSFCTFFKICFFISCFVFNVHFIQVIFFFFWLLLRSTMYSRSKLYCCCSRSNNRPLIVSTNICIKISMSMFAEINIINIEFTVYCLVYYYVQEEQQKKKKKEN